MEPILKVENASRYFGKFAAVKDVSLEVYPGEICGIAGPNGAGKTTLFNMITNIPAARDLGRIYFKGKDITRFPPHKICHLGIARTFQTPAIYPSMSVYQNVIVGSFFGNDLALTKVFSGSLKPDASFGKKAIESLDTVGLLAKKGFSAKGLTLYEIKLIMLASALVTNPSVLLLDEPAGGLGKGEIDKVIELVKQLNQNGLTVILIEHRMEMLMNLSHRVTILDHGERICQGSPKEVSCDPKVIEAYLGTKYLYAAHKKTK